MSSESKSGRNAAMTSKEVEKIMSPTAARARRSPASRTPSAAPRHPAHRGPSCAARRSARRAATCGSSTPGPNEPTTLPTVAPRPNSVISSPPALVAMSATAEHPVADDVGVLPGVRHHRHAAHRVPDEHHRPAGAGGVHDGGEVAAELGHRAVLERRLARAAVPALVVGDDPEAGVDQGPALQHPALHATG